MNWIKAERKWTCWRSQTKTRLSFGRLTKKEERVWSLNHLSAKDQIAVLEVRLNKEDDPQIFRRHKPSDGVLPRSVWDKKTYAHESMAVPR